MDRRPLLKRLDTAWLAFTTSYAGLSDAQLLEPGVTGAWSIRDIIVHVTTWEEEALNHLPATLEGRRPPRYSVTYGGIDAFNALMTRKKEGLSLSEVFRQQEEIHRRVIDMIERAPKDQLIGETRFRRRLRLDTYNHYPKHTEAIRRWRAQRQASWDERSNRGHTKEAMKDVFMPAHAQRSDDQAAACTRPSGLVQSY